MDVNQFEMVDVAFDLQWLHMSDNGFCDELGGGEYRRVLARWKAEGRPESIQGLILLHANLYPGRQGPCDACGQ